MINFCSVFGKFVNLKPKKNLPNILFLCYKVSEVFDFSKKSLMNMTVETSINPSQMESDHRKEKLQKPQAGTTSRLMININACYLV